MFEHAVIAYPVAASRRQLFLFPVSVALHSALILSALFATIWRIEFPGKAPAQIYSFRVSAPLPPLAAAPPPRSVTRTPVQVIPRQPVIAPQVLPQETPAPLPEPIGGGVPEGSDQGIPGGQAGGIPGGVRDGVVGGVPLEGPAVEPFAGAPLPVGGEVLPPTIIYKVSPAYPGAAHKIRLQGSVMIQAIIDRNGQLRNVAVLRSSSPLFNDAAMTAVQQWKFTAGSMRGRPVDTIFELKIVFKLNS